jgi:hypothetical protein
MIWRSARSASASGTPMSAVTFCSASGSSASTSSPMNTFDRPVLARDAGTDAVPLRATWQADEAMAQASVTATRAGRDGAAHDRRGPAWEYSVSDGGQPGANAMLVIIAPLPRIERGVTIPWSAGPAEVTLGICWHQSRFICGPPVPRRDAAWQGS